MECEHKFVIKEVTTEKVVPAFGTVVEVSRVIIFCEKCGKVTRDDESSPY